MLFAVVTDHVGSARTHTKTYKHKITCFCDAEKGQTVGYVRFSNYFQRLEL